MKSLTDQIVVGLGEVLWDCFADSRRPGGAPANVAFHAGQLGHRGVVCSRVGTDELGRELVDYLHDRNMETAYIQRDRRRTTGRVTVDASIPERPTFVIHEDVAWDSIGFNADLKRLMGEASAVCFGTLAQRSRRSRETIHRSLACADNALIVYDVNLRQLWYQREWIEKSMAAARIVKLNVNEVSMLAGLLDIGSADPEAFGRAVRKRVGVDIVCVTRAADGCVLIAPDQTVDVPGVQVEVADAVGAGDAFTAALISGCLRGWSLQKTAAFANEVGALVASRPGAMPVLVDDLAALSSKVEAEANQ